MHSDGAAGVDGAEGAAPAWHGELRVCVCDPRTEKPGASADGAAGAHARETYVSYGVRAETTLPHFRHARLQTRRRFQDFVFLHDTLVKEFPACIVPPLPEKRRIGYLIGDRFSEAFVQKRLGELQLFLERVCRHPTLQRATVLRQFLASEEWVRGAPLTQHIDMHTHTGRPVARDGDDSVHAAAAPHSLLEQVSDTVLNAFAKVRKPDARFVAIQAALAREDEDEAQLRRVLLRNRTHVSGTYAGPWRAAPPSMRERDDLRLREVAAFDELYATSLGASTEDLATDYDDVATALDELAVLESGMAPALMHTAAALRSAGAEHARFTAQCTDAVLTQLHSQQAYAHAHQAPLRLRESKQLDFEGLTDYLAHEVAERDRLDALGRGAARGGNIRGTGVRGYVRSTLDKVLGVDEEQARIERLERLDARIDELNGAVRAAHDQALALNEHVLQEHRVYTLGRRREVHALLRRYAQGHMELYRAQAARWDELVAALERDAPAPALGAT